VGAQRAEAAGGLGFVWVGRFACERRVSRGSEKEEADLTSYRFLGFFWILDIFGASFQLIKLYNVLTRHVVIAISSHNDIWSHSI
jgi:hypothetical protein